MAVRKKKTAKRSSGGNVPKARPPKHLRKVDRSQIDGWYSLQSMAPVHGTVLGREKRFDDQGYIIKIKLEQPCPALKKGGREVTLSQGNVLAVDERHQLKEVGESVGKEVYFVPTEQVEIKGGKTMWVFDVYLSEGDSETVAESEEDEDDLNF